MRSDAEVGDDSQLILQQYFNIGLMTDSRIIDEISEFGGMAKTVNILIEGRPGFRLPSLAKGNELERPFGLHSQDSLSVNGMELVGYSISSHKDSPRVSGRPFN